MVDISLVFQGLVALTTGLLASATFWLAWNSVQERKTAKQRELAIGIYNPVRADIIGWVQSERSYVSKLGESWPSLKQTQLHLIASVPDSIVDKLDAIEPKVSRANFLKDKMNTFIQDTYTKLVGEHYPQANFGGSRPYDYTFIRLMVEGRFVRSIEPALIWLKREKLDDYATAYVSKQFEGKKWQLELNVHTLPAFDQKEAGLFCERVFSALDKDLLAVELRNLLDSISIEGKEINALIEAELKKG